MQYPWLNKIKKTRDVIIENQKYVKEVKIGIKYLEKIKKNSILCNNSGYDIYIAGSQSWDWRISAIWIILSGCIVHFFYDFINKITIL